MAQKFLRVRVSDDLHKRFRMICVRLELSAPKQLSAILKNFVEAQEENERRMPKSKE